MVCRVIGDEQGFFCGGAGRCSGFPLVLDPSGLGAEGCWRSSHFFDHFYPCPLFAYGMNPFSTTSADWKDGFVLYDPYSCLEFWPSFCSEAILPFVSNGCLFVMDCSPLYELIPMHSTDDGRVGYPGDSHSYLDCSSCSLPSLPADVESHERCRHPVVWWLAPPCPPFYT